MYDVIKRIHRTYDEYGEFLLFLHHYYQYYDVMICTFIFSILDRFLSYCQYKRVERNAYVLMRIFNNGSEESLFFDRLEKAIESVGENKKNYRDGKVILVLCDNSSLENKKKKEHEDKLLEICKKHNFTKKGGSLEYFYSVVPGNSAYATFRVREKFLNLTDKDKTAFAVSLDQDDRLKPHAICNIAKRMQAGGVVLSSFEVIKDGGKDITDKGMEMQEKVTNAIIRNHVVNSFTFSRIKPSEIYYAVTMGWTKSYSREALQSYQRSLRYFLHLNRGGIFNFYNKHQAYEDFIDFYVLLRSDITIYATSFLTHEYYKHKESITCNPSVDDFRLHRTASLLALIDMCYSNSAELRPDFKQLLLRFITVKIVDIERILKGYREDYKNGNDKYHVFADDTHENYFISKLYRLSQGESEDRGNKQDRDLFADAEPVRSEKTKENFNDLFSCENINSIKDYHSDLKNVSIRTVVQKAYREENKFRKNESDKKEKKKKNLLPDTKPTPNQGREKLLFRIILFYIPFFLGCILILYPIIIKCITNTPVIIAPIVSVLIALYTFLGNEYSKTRVLAKEELAKKILYFSEFEDLIRHLEANLKVMIEIRRQLENNKLENNKLENNKLENNKLENNKLENNEDKIPSEIHFTNLSWPNFSCLLSDDITKVLDKNKVDDFSRLKVNIRNIDNSSKWLTSFVQAPHTNKELCDALDWEITRHIGYLINFCYLKDHDFQSAAQNDLEFYIGEKHMKQYLTELFIPYHDKEHGENIRMKMVNKYLDYYFTDRREHRHVLFEKGDA